MARVQLVDVIAPYVEQKEALAEAVLERALSRDTIRRNFAVAAGIDRRRNLVGIERQVRSTDGAARHDLVLQASNGPSVQVELKGLGPFTLRQLRALRRGPDENAERRIDVVVVVDPGQLPATLHPKIKVMTWKDVDRVLAAEGYGKLSGLWMGQTRLDVYDVLEDARRYVAYSRGLMGDATWERLWQPIDFIRTSLSDDVDIGRQAGPRVAENFWYYGANARVHRRWFWLGWIFRGGNGKRRPDQLAFVVEDEGGLWRRRHDPALQSEYPGLQPAVRLWNWSGQDEVLDVAEIVRGLRRLLKRAR